MAEKRACPLCDQPLEEPPAIHDLIRCEKAELLKARLEIKKLKKSLDEWKDAWFQLREIIGKLWWHHPAIDNDEQRSYYQKQQHVTYDGFVGTKADWHYKSWTNK